MYNTTKINNYNLFNYNALTKNINKFLTGKTLYKTPLILSVVTVILLFVSFPAIDIGCLVWVALVPWLMLIKIGNRVAASSLFIGVLFFLMSLIWFRYVTYAAWILVSLYLTAYFLVFGFCANYIVRRCRIPLTLIAPFLWVSLEYIRSFLITGFPWLFLGHSQYLCLPLIQVTDITGVYGVSFLIVLINAAVVEIISRFCIVGCRPPASHLLINIVLPVLLFAGVAVYGYVCLKHNNSVKGPKITVVQGNILQSVKNSPDDMQQARNLQKYVNLSLMSAGSSERADLVIWPETMAPGILNINPDFSGRSIDKISQSQIINLAYLLNTRLLIGGTSIKIDGKDQTFFNSAFYYDNFGTIINRYDKVHLVPFGEYTPLKDYFPFLAKLVPYDVSLSPGSEMRIFSLPVKDINVVDYKFGVLICYEDTVPTLVREFVKKGADFMVNITNDGWFGKSAELNQHLAIMAFRAVENRRALVRAANTGISAFIDINGRIYDRLVDENGEFKEVEGSLTNNVMINKRRTLSFYTRNGDLLAIASIVVTVALLIWAAVKHYHDFRRTKTDGN